MKIQLIASLLIFALPLVTASCKNKDPKADCGCDSPSIKDFKDANAVYLGSGVFSVSREQKQGADTGGFNMLIACNADSSWVKSEDAKVADYVVSGSIRRQCPTDISLWGGYQPVTISKVAYSR